MITHQPSMSKKLHSAATCSVTCVTSDHAYPIWNICQRNFHAHIQNYNFMSFLLTGPSTLILTNTFQGLLINNLRIFQPNVLHLDLCCMPHIAYSNLRMLSIHFNLKHTIPLCLDLYITNFCAFNAMLSVAYYNERIILIFS